MCSRARPEPDREEGRRQQFEGQRLATMPPPVAEIIGPDDRPRRAARPARGAGSPPGHRAPGSPRPNVDARAQISWLSSTKVQPKARGLPRAPAVDLPARANRSGRPDRTPARSGCCARGRDARRIAALRVRPLPRADQVAKDRPVRRHRGIDDQILEACPMRPTPRSSLIETLPLPLSSGRCSGSEMPDTRASTARHPAQRPHMADASGQARPGKSCSSGRSRFPCAGLPAARQSRRAIALARD